MAFEESDLPWDPDNPGWCRQSNEHETYDTPSDYYESPAPPALVTNPIAVTLVISPRNRRQDLRRARSLLKRRTSGIGEIRAIFEKETGPSKILLTMCRQLAIEAERDFLFAFFEKIVGVRPTRTAIIGRRKKDMVRTLDGVNKGAFTEAFQNPAVRLDVLNLLRNFFVCGSAEGFQRAGTYEIKVEL
jgi:hypothetical protein